jgi:hypothetical protein
MRVLALALVSALLWPPWQTVAQGSPLSGGKPRPSAAAFVAGTPAGTSRFTGFLLPADATAVRRADFRSKVIVAAILSAPTPCYKTEIVGLRRARKTLIVTAARHEPPPGTVCILTLGWPYHVIAVPRTIIGRPLPKKIILRIERRR